MPIKRPKILSALFVLLFLLTVCFSGGSGAKSIDDISALVKEEVIRREPMFKNHRIEVSFKDGDQIIERIDANNASKKLDFKLDFPENKRLLGRLILPVDIYENGVHKNKVNLRAAVAVFAKVPYNTGNMQKDQVLAAGNIGLAEKDIAYLPSTVILDPKKVVGKETTTFIPKNTVLLEWMLRKTPLVKKGDEISLVKRGKGILVRARGISLDDGYLGSTISVRNIDSGKTVQGKVTGAKEIEPL